MWGKRTDEMKILVDHNLKGHAALLFVTLKEDGWVELLDLSFVYFHDLESCSEESFSTQRIKGSRGQRRGQTQTFDLL